MRAMVVLTVALGVALAGCAGAGGGGQADPTGAATSAATPPGGSEPAPTEGDTITGTLGGDAQLEGGCVWVQVGATRWQVLWPDGYTVSTDPISVSGPAGVEITEGDTVTVAGSEQTDVMTTCQVGPVWAASSVKVGD